VGRYFDELTTDERFSSAPRTVTGADIDAFVRLTGDDNRLHTDDDFARAAGFSGRIAHGALVVSLATGLAWSTGLLTDTTLAFRSIESWKFSLPVYPGDAISLHGRVAEKRPLRQNSGLVRFEMEVRNQRDEVVGGGSLRMLMRARPG
jgi:acyl dehydratase